MLVDSRGWKSHIIHVSICWWCQTNGIWAFTQRALNMHFFHIVGSVLFILSLCMGGLMIDHVFSGYAVATSTQLSINYPLSVSVVPQFAVWWASLNIVLRRKERWWRLKVVSHGHQTFIRHAKVCEDGDSSYLYTYLVCGLNHSFPQSLRR